MLRFIIVSLILISQCAAQKPDRIAELAHYKQVNKPGKNSVSIMKKFLAQCIDFPSNEEIKDFFSFDYRNVKTIKAYSIIKGGEKKLLHEVKFTADGLPYRIYTVSFNIPVVQTFSYSGPLLKGITADNGIKFEVKYDNDSLIIVYDRLTEVYWLVQNMLFKKQYALTSSPEGKPETDYSENKLEGKCNNLYLNEKLLNEKCFSHLDKQVPYYVKYTDHIYDGALPTKEIKIDSRDPSEYKIYSLSNDNGKKAVYTLMRNVFLNDSGLILRIISQEDPMLIEFEYEYFK